jgi:putative heme-binding domain-containing protein
MSRNEWSSRHARRILQERAQKSRKRQLEQSLPKTIAATTDSFMKLRGMWALHSSVGLIRPGQRYNGLVDKLLRDPNEYVRAWAIQLICEDKKVDPEVLKRFERLAVEDKSPVVRLYLAAAMQRIPAEERWEVVKGIGNHREDSQDHNLPLMIWYAAEPLAAKDPARALSLASGAESFAPCLLNFTVRRAAALNTTAAYSAIVKSLLPLINKDDKREFEILGGLQAALKGQRTAPKPEGWEEVEKLYEASRNSDLRAQVQSLSLTFGSPVALSALKKTLMDKSADPAVRKKACDSLLAAKASELAPSLQELLADPDLQGTALRGLAAYDDAKTPAAILSVYNSLSDTHKRDALNTLASRAAYAKPLLAAVSSGNVAKKDLTADLVRQLRNLKSAELDEQIAKVWGVMRESAADKQTEIEKYKKIFYAGGSQPGDASRGRAVFSRVCQQCHTLFDTGGKVGPDLTGSNRGDLDYILQNIVDPNAVIPNDYRAWNLETTDGRSMSGILKQQDEASVTIVTANETLVLPRKEIASLSESQLSMMPEGLLQQISEQEVRDLIYYLRGPAQAPMPAGAESAGAFFNGKDLAGWDGDKSLWSVEGGEIVGRTKTGLKHNEFLKSQLALEDFRLVLKVKLIPNKENSGIQFRSERFGDFEMKGPQADIGAGWWGKLYEENGRALLSSKPGDSCVKSDDWNTYEVVAVGTKIRTAINGQLCVDLDDPKISRRGIIGLQMHAGGPLEVHFKDLRLELNPKFELLTVGAQQNNPNVTN